MPAYCISLSMLSLTYSMVLYHLLLFPFLPSSFLTTFLPLRLYRTPRCVSEVSYRILLVGLAGGPLPYEHRHAWEEERRGSEAGVGNIEM
ncbi:hypothetical protein HOY82DRAFT_567382 [Tuber indicum]|nr:hypothetical protein HOY82DRAFT_567382 [Tuber indicum]